MIPTSPALLWSAVLLCSTRSAICREELDGLTGQRRRAGVSIASNIAEGSGGGTHGDYRSFLRVARGSAPEVQTQLILAGDLDFGDSSQIAEAEQLAEQISKVLRATIQRL